MCVAVTRVLLNDIISVDGRRATGARLRSPGGDLMETQLVTYLFATGVLAIVLVVSAYCRATQGYSRRLADARRHARSGVAGGTHE